MAVIFPVVVFAGGVLVATIALFASGWARWRRSVRLADTPTAPPSAVPFGRAECSGQVAVPAGWSTVGRVPCAWYSFELERYVSDDDGGSWQTVVTGRSSRVFYLVDPHGAVLVDPNDATVDGVGGVAPDGGHLTLDLLMRATQSVVATPRLDPSQPIGAYRGRWRVTEKFLPCGRVATALGPVLPQPDEPGSPVFRTDPNGVGAAARLYIAAGTAEAVEEQNRRGRWRMGAAPLLPVPFVVVSRVVGGSVASWAGWASVLLGCTAVGLATGIAVRWALDQYNRIVATANQVEACWSMVDVALARRATLVPQLVAVVEAAFAHDAEVQESLAVTRWQIRDRGSIDAASAAGAVAVAIAPRIAALAERYPSLTSNENALALQRELADTEHRLASARTVYNDAVALLRTRMQQFPGSLLAGRFRARRSTYWQI